MARDFFSLSMVFLLLAADPFRGGGTAEAATAPPDVSSFEASFLVKAITQEFLAVSDILASPPLETAFLGGLISAAAAEASAASFPLCNSGP